MLRRSYELQRIVQFALELDLQCHGSAAWLCFGQCIQKPALVRAAERTRSRCEQWRSLRSALRCTNAVTHHHRHPRSVHNQSAPLSLSLSLPPLFAVCQSARAREGCTHDRTIQRGRLERKRGKICAPSFSLPSSSPENLKDGRTRFSQRSEQ